MHHTSGGLLCASLLASRCVPGWLNVFLGTRVGVIVLRLPVSNTQASAFLRPRAGCQSKPWPVSLFCVFCLFGLTKNIDRYEWYLGNSQLLKKPIIVQNNLLWSPLLVSVVLVITLVLLLDLRERDGETPSPYSYIWLPEQHCAVG